IRRDPGGRGRGPSVAAEAAANEGAGDAEAVDPGELLAVFGGAGVVADGCLVDALAALEEAGDDLGLDREAGLAEWEGAEEVGAHHLVTGHEVADVDAEEDVGE